MYFIRFVCGEYFITIRVELPKSWNIIFKTDKIGTRNYHNLTEAFRFVIKFIRTYKLQVTEICSNMECELNKGFLTEHYNNSTKFRFLRQLTTQDPVVYCQDDFVYVMYTQPFIDWIYNNIKEGGWLECISIREYLDNWK